MPFQLVLAQLASSEDKRKNLEKARKAVKESKEIYGADIVVFPEVYMSTFNKDITKNEILSDAEDITGQSVTGMKKLAKEYGVWIIFGFREKCEEDKERVYNSVAILNSEGELVSSYRKTHMYDAFGAMESKNNKPGDKLFEPIDTPFGKLGLFVCYELRFPEISRYEAIKGADIIIVPTAWVSGPLKEHHWDTLLTARAIENTVFMVGCDQSTESNRIGRSKVVDPMGVSVVTGSETEELIPCSIDLERIKAVRKKLPSHLHRRPELYNTDSI